MAQMIANRKPLKKASIVPAAEAEPSGDPSKEAHLSGILGGKSKLKKATPSSAPAPEDANKAFLNEISARAASRKESVVTGDAIEQVVVARQEASMEAASAVALNPLAAEIQSSSLAPVESKFKAASQPSPVPTLGRPVATPKGKQLQPSQTGPTSAAVLSHSDRPVAPTIDEDGKPIPAWKQKILQKRLDADFQKVLDAQAAHKAKEDRWVGIPSWKRAMLEKKEAAAAGAGSEELAAAAAPAPAASAAAPPAPAAAAPDQHITSAASMLKKTTTKVVEPVQPSRPTPAKWVPPPKSAAAAPPAPTGARFDPMTGKPLAAPAAPQPRFDPMTGKPIAAAPATAVHPMVAQAGGRSGGAATAAPSAPAEAADEAPLAEWKSKLVSKKKAQNQKEIDDLRAQKAAAEARWIGVPGWKRAIIEKKEEQLNGV
jgi:epidermal growth factor receptor kinase substrate 8